MNKDNKDNKSFARENNEKKLITYLNIFRKVVDNNRHINLINFAKSEAQTENIKLLTEHLGHVPVDDYRGLKLLTINGKIRLYENNVGDYDGKKICMHKTTESINGFRLDISWGKNNSNKKKNKNLQCRLLGTSYDFHTTLCELLKLMKKHLTKPVSTYSGNYNNSNNSYSNNRYESEIKSRPELNDSFEDLSDDENIAACSSDTNTTNTTYNNNNDNFDLLADTLPRVSRVSFGQSLPYRPSKYSSKLGNFANNSNSNKTITLSLYEIANQNIGLYDMLVKTKLYLQKNGICLMLSYAMTKSLYATFLTDYNAKGGNAFETITNSYQIYLNHTEKYEGVIYSNYQLFMKELKRLDEIITTSNQVNLE